MKRIILLLICFIANYTYGQNTFPANGSVAIGTAPLPNVQLLVNGMMRNTNGILEVQKPGTSSSGVLIEDAYMKL